MLKVHSIFESISGEAGGLPQGAWCSFVRLQGCNLRCSYCDTPQAQEGLADGVPAGTPMKKLDVLKRLDQLGNNRVLITGGEPLFQPEIIELLESLAERGYEVQVETNGSLVTPPIPWVHWVVDIKCPSSGMSGMMLPLQSLSYALESLDDCRQGNRGSIHFKFVVGPDEDLYFALEAINTLSEWNSNFIISPVDARGERIAELRELVKGSLHPEFLDWITFSVQLHKIFNLP